MVVWTEPKLPPYVKVNPDAEPGIDDAQQPGELSMRLIAEEFLESDEPEST